MCTKLENLSMRVRTTFDHSHRQSSFILRLVLANDARETKPKVALTKHQVISVRPTVAVVRDLTLDFYFDRAMQDPLAGPSSLRDIVRPQFHQVNLSAESFVKDKLGVKLDKGLQFLAT